MKGKMDDFCAIQCQMFEMSISVALLPNRIWLGRRQIPCYCFHLILTARQRNQLASLWACYRPNDEIPVVGCLCPRGDSDIWQCDFRMLDKAIVEKSKTVAEGSTAMVWVWSTYESLSSTRADMEQ